MLYQSTILRTPFGLKSHAIAAIVQWYRRQESVLFEEIIVQAMSLDAYLTCEYILPLWTVKRIPTGAGVISLIPVFYYDEQQKYANPSDLAFWKVCIEKDFPILITKMSWWDCVYELRGWALTLEKIQWLSTQISNDNVIDCETKPMPRFGWIVDRMMDTLHNERFFQHLV